ncbi:MAG: hypothetical protein JW863_09225 [Chitinispirillaceae bacterium]|nr:hypothetical protein [Chitinispirillaceae bacterium]
MHLEIADIPFDLDVPDDFKSVARHLFCQFISRLDQQQRASFSVIIGNEHCKTPDFAGLISAGNISTFEQNDIVDEKCYYRFLVVSAQRRGLLILSHRSQSTVALIFSAFKWFFTFMVLQRGGLPLHSSSIIYKGKGFLFSGDSGKGKSTISSLLTSNLSEIQFGSDELNVLYCKNNNLILYSTPFHSSNGPGELEYQHHAEVDSVFFLEQAALNRVEFLKRTQVFQYLLHNSYHIPADALLTTSLLDTVERFSEFTCFRLLHFINNKTILTFFHTLTDGCHATENC